MEHFEIIKKPIVTEKTTALAKRGIYTFEVARRATIAQIKEAINLLFGVKAVSIRTLVEKGSARRLPKSRRLVLGEETKKAYVTVEKGKKIEIFSGS